jgi:hypothetical protein
MIDVKILSFNEWCVELDRYSTSIDGFGYGDGSGDGKGNGGAEKGDVFYDLLNSGNGAGCGYGEGDDGFGIGYDD